MKKCPACESEKQKHIGIKNDFDLMRCNYCKTIYSDSEQNTSFDYTTYYDNTNLDVPDFVKGRLAEIVSEFDSFRQNNRLLDIGCGAGYLLEEAQKQQWQVLGTEISDPAVEDLRIRGINVFQGDISQIISEHNSYDVVISTEVIEHVSDPASLAESAYLLLRNDGLFWGTTPNGKGISANLLCENWSVVAPPEHIQLFSKRGLEITLQRAGFRKVVVTTQGVNPLEIYQHFIKKIKKPSNSDKQNDVQQKPFDRVNTSYKINATLSQGLAKTLIKTPANMLLNFVGLGDSLKFWAIK